MHATFLLMGPAHTDHVDKTRSGRVEWSILEPRTFRFKHRIVSVDSERSTRGGGRACQKQDPDKVVWTRGGRFGSEFLLIRHLDGVTSLVLPAAPRVYVNQRGDSRALAGESDLEASRPLQSITEMCMLAGHALRSEGMGFAWEKRRSTNWWFLDVDGRESRISPSSSSSW